MSYCDLDNFDLEKVDETFFCQENQMFNSEYDEQATFFIEDETKATESFYSNDLFDKITEEIINSPEKEGKEKQKDK